MAVKQTAFILSFVLNRVIKLRVLNRVCISGSFALNRVRVKPSAAPLYPNIGRVPTQGFLVLVTMVIVGDRPRYGLDFSSYKLGSRPNGKKLFRAPAKAQNRLCEFINWEQISATVITERVIHREHERHAGNVLGGGQEN